MPTDTKLNQLIINQLTQEQYDEAKAAGTLSDTELYITDSDDDALTNNNISNCITEIPQDIKLELNNGTLTLKAGSKVYVPNGVGKFDEVTINSDLILSISDNSKYFIFYNLSNNSLWFSSITATQSGATNPSNLWGFFYNITDNKVYYLRNNTTPDDMIFSLPLATVISDGTQITSIDQVFNGFGYIGSTIFALPGVKGLIPNGRNADGSLKSIEVTTSSVKIITYDSQTFNEFDLCFNGNSFDWYTNFNVKEDNYCYNGNSKITQTVNVGRFRINQSSDNGKIAWFTSKTVFHALDYNDKSTISGWSMPSSRYIDLTLGASGSTYIAPANGWFCVAKKSGGTNQYLGLISYGLEFTDYYNSNLIARNFIPCKKGGNITVNYNMTGNTQYFRFIFAEGEN